MKGPDESLNKGRFPPIHGFVGLDALLVIIHPRSANLAVCIVIINPEAQYGDGGMRNSVDMGILIQSDPGWGIQPPVV